MEKLNLEIEQAFNLSQKIGNVASWLQICDTGEMAWSKEANHLYGIPEDVPITWELMNKLLHPDDGLQLKQSFEKAMRDGEFHSLHRLIIDGQIKWFEERGKLYQDDKTGYTYMIGMSHDCTWIKQQQDVLDIRKQEFNVITSYLAETTNTTSLQCIVASAKRTIRKVMNVALVGIFVLQDGEFTRIIPKNAPSPEAFLNQPKEDYTAYHTILSGKMLTVALSEYHNKASMQELIALGGESIVSLPIKYHGETFAALSVVMKTPEMSEDELAFCNTICGYLSAQLKNALLYQQLEKELAERVRAEEHNAELQHSMELEKLRSEFFSNLSHEFKTPLNIILSSIELLKMKLSMDKSRQYEQQYEKFCAYMEQNAYRLLHLTTNLLDSTKIDSGFLDVHFECWNIIEVLSLLIKSSEAHAQVRDIELQFISEMQESPDLVFDRDKVERIVLNLLSNAIKSTDRGGKIHILLTDSEDVVTLSVSDTGCGIDNKLLPHIFDKFLITDGGLTKRSEGSGMGLSIVKSLVEMHGGEVFVASVVGEGTTFGFTISKHLKNSTPSRLDEAYLDNIRSARLKMELSELGREK